MANLLRDYRELSDQQKQVKGHVYSVVVVLVPNALKKMIKGSGYYNEANDEVKDPDKLMAIIERFEGTFKQAKEDFMKQYTLQKLLSLVDKEYGFHSAEVDIGFLEQHVDKLTSGTLSHLHNLVTRRDSLFNKIFKTRDIKMEIERLDGQIDQEQGKIYKEIIGWYQSQSKDVLDLRRNVGFTSTEGLMRDLKMCEEDISAAEQNMASLKVEIQKAREEIEQKKQDYEARKNEVAQQIRALGGVKYKETDIHDAEEKSDDNLKKIIDASRDVYQRELINRVQQEAQNQADMREAELRGIPVDQLLQMKQQGLLDESMGGVPQEEVSPGMKM